MSIERDKVLLEGWWKKIPGKGNINKKKTSHRYFMLTERYLDWYEKPGYKRKGTASLDQNYVRRHPDNLTLVVGTFGGKEFKIQSEGQDPQDRANEWYDRITKQMDKCKQQSASGETRKRVVNEGIPEVKPEPTKVQVTETVQSAPPPAVVQQQVAAPVTITPPITSVVSAPVTQTIVSPAPIMTSPLATTTTYGPFGATTTISQPVLPTPQMMQTTITPFGTVTTTTGTMSCLACRNQFANTGGSIVRCPFCGYLNASATLSSPMMVMPTATLMPTPTFVTMPTATVTYSTPTFY